MAKDLITPEGHTVPAGEIEMTAVRAQGPGGQNVNKVASAVHLRFDIGTSSLPADLRLRLGKLNDRRINAEGIIVIKAQNHRTQERNREEALSRLVALIDEAGRRPRRRIPTRPGRAAKERRLKGKKQRSAVKQMRRKPIDQG